MSNLAKPTSSTESTASLTHWGAARIAREIAAGRVSARQVVEAFARRIEHVDKCLNAVVVRLLDQALDEARAADEAQALGRPLGPLHGVPITIKECFQVAGTAATLGLVSRANDVASSDGQTVGQLRQAGAIVLGKTNVPQLMLWHESDNPLYGRTNNPWDLSRTAGGSSGGEAAIIAAAGSPLGLGSDMGGSLRIPAHFCGIHALKPTSHRLSRGGLVHALRGMEAIAFQPGPMARRVEDLELAMRVLCRPAASGGRVNHDAAPGELPDPRAVKLGPLGVAVWNDDPFFPVSPAIKRAVDDAADILFAHGCQRRSISVPTAEWLNVYYGIAGADGGADVRRLLRGNPADPCIRQLLRISAAPNWLRPLLAHALRWMGQSYASDVVRSARSRSTDEYWQLAHRLSRIVQQCERRMDEAGIDLIVSPAFATPAPRHGDAFDMLPAACYSFLPNLLGFPAGLVATSRVRNGEESERKETRDWAVRKAVRAERGSRGLPVGVQLVARHWREDVVLAAMRLIESESEGRDGFPGVAEPQP